MPKAVLAPGARIQCRDAEWLVRNVRYIRAEERLLDVVGVSPFLQGQTALFLEALEPDLKVLQPEDTELVGDNSDNYRDSLLFIEAHLRVESHQVVHLTKDAPIDRQGPPPRVLLSW